MAYSVNHFPLPTHGYWGEITSTLHWCEHKYRWSKYVAEPVNTFTNIFFVLLSLYGARRCRQENLPRRFELVNLGIATVGVGSFLFHGTLKYEAQLMDELPMLWVSTLLLYCVFEISPAHSSPPPFLRYVMPTILFTMVSSVTAAYIYSSNPVFHQVCYGLIQAASTFQTFYLLYSSRAKLAATPTAKAQRKQIRNIYGVGATTFLLGFLLWNIDNGFCGQLRALREKVGSPWSGFLELHGAWHILTGLGAFYILIACELLCLSIKEEPDNWRLTGPTLLPYVERVREYDAEKAKAKEALEAKKAGNGSANGKLHVNGNGKAAANSLANGLRKEL